MIYMPLYLYHANNTCFSQSKASCTCQALLLERMLNFYEELFKDMQSEHKDERNNPQYVMNEVKKLRQNYIVEHKVWKELQEINSLKVNIKRKSCLHCECVHFQLLNCCLSYDIRSCDIIYDMVSNTNVCSYSHKVKNGTIRGGALNDFLMVFERAYTEKHKQV